ncbi:hypothetical protein MTR_7g053610 [Medicago truncatula]|uniref:Uncharacterized protein n=1 Tax=Medicago truncatula TaxID=3880 RepID=A0A072U9R3_MEDTR|nr:hypothetical protein MTR_7g053610 [Medicago truncatula]
MASTVIAYNGKIPTIMAKPTNMTKAKCLEILMHSNRNEEKRLRGIISDKKLALNHPSGMNEENKDR